MFQRYALSAMATAAVTVAACPGILGNQVAALRVYGEDDIILPDQEIREEPLRVALIEKRDIGQLIFEIGSSTSGQPKTSSGVSAPI